jgi:hypothetical protein
MGKIMLWAAGLWFGYWILHDIKVQAIASAHALDLGEGSGRTGLPGPREAAARAHWAWLPDINKL